MRCLVRGMTPRRAVVAGMGLTGITEIGKRTDWFLNVIANADSFEHAANMTVASLPNPHAIRIPVPRSSRCLRTSQFIEYQCFAFRPDPMPEPPLLIRSQRAPGPHVIQFFNIMPGMHQRVSKFTIIGHNQQALAGLIQAADGKHSFSQRGGKQGSERPPTPRIAGGAYNVPRLINEQVNFAFRANRPAIHLNPLNRGMNTDTLAPDNNTIHRHPATVNQALTRAPGT